MLLMFLSGCLSVGEELAEISQKPCPDHDQIVGIPEPFPRYASAVFLKRFEDKKGVHYIYCTRSGTPHGFRTYLHNLWRSDQNITWFDWHSDTGSRAWIQEEYGYILKSRGGPKRMEAYAAKTDHALFYEIIYPVKK